MAKFSKARRALLSELKPAVEAVRTIREDRQALARLNRKLKRNEARHLQTVRQIELAMDALQQCDWKVASDPKQLDLWSGLASGERSNQIDKAKTAAQRLAKKVARRHDPKERSALLRLAGLFGGGLARLRSGHDRKAVGMVTVSFDPNSRRDVLRVLEQAGIYVEKGRLRHKATDTAKTRTVGLDAKNQTRRGL